MAPNSRSRHLLAVACGACVLALTLGGASDAAAGRRVPLLHRDWTQLPVQPDGRDPVAAEQRRQKVVNQRWHQVHDLVGGQHVSARSRKLLQERGLGATRLGKSGFRMEAWDGVDVLRVLIVRVSFETNRQPNLTTVAPDGDFDLRVLPDDPDTIRVDPPPRNRSFFESHLEGLSEFYEYQSGGRLIIEGQVLPAGENDSYKLGDPADYGPGADNFWTLASLESLVRDMIVTADEGTQADGGPFLADYDDDNPFTYIIFVHAGSDWQSDVNGDSPNDIPTFFVTLGEPQPLTSVDNVTGMPGSLSECSVIPETTNQDDYAGSIAAAFYHEFGHALGLPDIYSTRTGLPSVGIWDLMDSGTNLPVPLGVLRPDSTIISTVATGVLPPSLSAWNKWYLGWLETGEIDNAASEHNLPAVGVPRDQYNFYRPVGDFDLDDPQALRGGLSPREWFLLENRWVPGGPGETPYDDLYLEQDDDTKVILYLAGESGGTAVNSGLYDYFLPAGGLLVWHVNMDRIEAGLVDNTINWYGDGLRLLEADGIQDVGVTDAFVLGWYGSVLDPFAGYQYDEFGDRQVSDYTNLYADGFPNSRAFDRSWTGLDLSKVRFRGGRVPSVLRFTGRIDPILQGFPWNVTTLDSTEAAASNGLAGPRAIDTASLTAFDYPGEPYVIFADAPPDDWTGDDWRPTLFAKSWRDRVVAGGPAGFPLGGFHRLNASLAGPPVAWIRADETAGMICATTRGEVTGFSAINSLNVPWLSWTATAGASLVGGPLVMHDGQDPAWVLAQVAPDSLVVLDVVDGSLLGNAVVLDQPGGGVTAAPRLLGGDGDEEACVFTDEAWYRCTVSAAGVSVARRTAYDRPAAGRVRTATVTDPGRAEVFVFDDTGLVGAWRRDGTPEDVDLRGLNTPLVTEPAVADLDGDGGDDLVLATADRVFAFHGNGTAVRGYPRLLRDLFPLADTTRVAGPLVVADVDGDGPNEVLFGTDQGHLLILGPAGKLKPLTPFRWGDRAGGSFAVGDAEADGPGRLLWLVSRGGYLADELGRHRVDGRLAPYRLGPVAADAARTSEWLAQGGGADRRGAMGASRSLGPVSSVAAEMDKPIVYPNPLHGDSFTVRFYSARDGVADIALHDLEGEVVARASASATAGTINECSVAVPGLASGMYLCRLRWDGPGGQQVKTMILAVEK